MCWARYFFVVAKIALDPNTKEVDKNNMLRMAAQPSASERTVHSSSKSIRICSVERENVWMAEPYTLKCAYTFYVGLKIVLFVLCAPLLLSLFKLFYLCHFCMQTFICSAQTATTTTKYLHIFTKNIFHKYLHYDEGTTTHVMRTNLALAKKIQNQEEKKKKTTKKNPPK